MGDVLEMRTGNVVTLTLNRPDSLNALSDGIVAALLEAFQRLGSDSSVGAIVLGASGRAFCAGGDLKALGGDSRRNRQQTLDWLRSAHRLPLEIAQCSKVTIASIQGPAIGAGLGLALCCDFRVASSAARFCPSFVKVGLSTDFGVSLHLSQLIGEARARTLLLSGENLEATEALALGLVNQVVSDEALPHEAAALARRYAGGPIVAHANIKRNLLAARTLRLADLLDFEADQQVISLETDDHREATRAFIERRTPVFGREQRKNTHHDHS